MLIMPMMPALTQVNSISYGENLKYNSSKQLLSNHTFINIKYINDGEYRDNKDNTEYYALITGCCEYENRRNNIPTFFNPFTESTMKYVYNKLINESNWKKENVFLLLNEDATKNNIISTLSDLGELIDENDVFLFSWMGHGTIVPDEDGDENDPFDEAICPYDTKSNNFDNVITDDELNECLSKIDAKGQILLFESCMSGGMADNENYEPLSFSDVNEKGRIVIMLTPPGKLGYVFYGIPWPISFLFSNALSEKKCDVNNDGWISAEEAFCQVDKSYSDFEDEQFLDMINKTIPKASLKNFIAVFLMLKKLKQKPIIRSIISGFFALTIYKFYQNEKVKQIILNNLKFQLQILSAENNPNMVDDYPGDLNIIKII